MCAKALCLVVAWTLLVQTAVAAPVDPHQQALALHTGISVKVRMLNGNLLQGTLGAVSADHFTLTLKTAGTRELAFADVRSIQRANLRTSTKVLLIAGIGVAVTALVFFIAVARAFGAFR